MFFVLFKPGFNVAKINLAEVHHSRWHHIGAENLTLIQACREDVAESIKLKRRLEGYRLGAYKGGRGPSADDLQRRRHVDQKKQAEAFCKELDSHVESGEEMHLRQLEHFVDEGASHRHDPVSKRVGMDAGACASLPEKPKQSLDKRLAPRRNTRSSKFLLSLQIAKSCQKSFHVGNRKVNDQYSQEITIIHKTAATYKVTIDKMPMSDDCKYCTTRDICSLILWALLYIYKVPEKSDLLHQRSFLNSELESIFKACERESSSATPTASATAIPTATGTAIPTATGTAMPTASATATATATPKVTGTLMPTVSATGTIASATATALTPKAAKDFNNPSYENQQWFISRVVSRGRTPTCSHPKCTRKFERGELSIQVMARWSPPYNTADGKKFTVDRTYHFCLKWSCLQKSPGHSNQLAPPGNIKLKEDFGPSLSSEDYQTIFTEHLPVEWMK